MCPIQEVPYKNHNESLRSMKIKDVAASPVVGSKARVNDSSKLVSLLALAAGALAMPQTSHADIIYTDLSSNPAQVGFAGGDSSSFNFSGLPGGVQFGFQNRTRTVITSNTYFMLTHTHIIHSVSVGHRGGPIAGIEATVNGFVAPQPNGAGWPTSIGSHLYYGAAVGYASNYGQQNPSSGYNQQYLRWVFQDATQGNALRYGWVEISLAVGAYPGGPHVTILGYAYDDQGNQIPMGATPVPEPAPIGILALGALALGAKGLRAWRRNRVAVCKS